MNRAQVSLSSLRVIDLGQPLGSWLLRSNQPRSFQDAHSACLAGLVALGATPLASLTSSSAAAHAAANAGAGARNAGDPRRLAALQSAKSTLAEGALGFEIWSEIMDAHKPEPFLATITRECGASSRSGGVNNGNGNGTAGCSATESTIHGKARQGSWAAAKLLVSAFTTALVGPPYTSDAAVDATGGGDATSSGAASTGGEGSKSTISGVDTRHYQRNEQQQQQVEGYQRRVHTVPAAALALVEHWAACAPKARQDATRARGQELKKDLVAALGDDGVAVWPSLPHVAPRHGGEVVCVCSWFLAWLYVRFTCISYGLLYGDFFFSPKSRRFYFTCAVFLFLPRRCSHRLLYSRWFAFWTAPTLLFSTL